MPRAHAVASAHALVALLAACHHPVHHPGEEFLDAIHFEGNHAIKDKDLRTGLALHHAQESGGAPDPYLVVVDGDRIRGMYVRKGYLEVEVRSRVERKGDAAVVTYTIMEGPRSNTRVVITGLPDDRDLPARKVRDLIKLADGKPFDYDAYDQAKEPLLGIVEDAGYAHARLDAHVFADRANHEAVVQLDYVTGPKCHFGKVAIVGAPEDLVDAVQERLAFAPGDTFSQATLAESQRAIYDMKRFSTVRILPDKSGGDTIDVKIALARGSLHEVSLGGGLGLDPAAYEVRGRASYAISGWPFPLDDVSIDLRPAYAMLRDGSGYEPRIRAMAKLRRIDLFWPFVVGEVEGGYNYITIESYTFYGPRARLGVHFSVFTKKLRMRVGWQLDRVDFSHISPLIDPTLEHQLGLDTTELVGEYQQAIALDLRDNPFEPRLGAYADVHVNEGTRYAGGAMSFVQVTPEGRGYVPVPGTGIVLAGRVRAGAFYGDVPATERYYSGGATTQRGFSERRLAPTLSGDVMGSFRSIPIGGGGLFESNIEARSELGKLKGMGLGGVVFLDGGDVTERFSEINLGRLHWALGTGARLFTPIGAVRFDIGFRLNRTGMNEPEPGSRYAFHLSIGEAY